jgi:excisionase family DNA binding protein
MDTLFSVRQAAFLLKVHPLTIRRYIKKGTLKAVKVAGNVRIREKDLSEFHKDILATPPAPSIFRTQKVTLDKPFSLKDPIFRLLGKGASL